MTLATTIAVTTPGINPELAFLKAREIIGIPAEHPFKIHADTGLGFDNGCWFASQPGGFMAALDVSHADGALLEVHDYDDEEPSFRPASYLSISLDTSYAYRGTNGEGCDVIHRRLTAEIGAWLSAQGAEWWGYDEFHGDWHRETPCPLSDADRKALA